MRTPYPGILPPKAKVRITPSPPIGEHEKAIVVSPGRKRPEGEPPPVSTEPDGGAVVLTNLKDGFTPYVLLIVERNAHETASQIYAAVKSGMAGRAADKAKKES